MKNILIFCILFVYIQVQAMENQNKPTALNLPLGNSLPPPIFLHNQPKTMFKTFLVRSKKELFLCQACEDIFFEERLAVDHGAQCIYCKGSIPKCLIKAHENECKYHTIQQ